MRNRGWGGVFCLKVGSILLFVFYIIGVFLYFGLSGGFYGECMLVNRIVRVWVSFSVVWFVGMVFYCYRFGRRCRGIGFSIGINLCLSFGFVIRWVGLSIWFVFFSFVNRNKLVFILRLGNVICRVYRIAFGLL